MNAKTLLTTILCAAVLSPVAMGQTARSKKEAPDHRREIFNFHKIGKAFGSGAPTPARPAPAPVAVAPTPAPTYRAPLPTANSAQINTELVHVIKSAPSSVAIGQEFDWTYTVLSKRSNKEVVVTDYIPEGFELVSASPEPQRTGNQLTWVFNNMEANQRENIKVRLRALTEGSKTSCFTVTAIPQACLTTNVGKAEIAITKTGPAEAFLGADVDYLITVSNTGNLPATDVVVTDTVPPGLSHSSGQSTLTFTVGDLPAGGSRQIPVRLNAIQKGRHCNQAKVDTSNAGTANAEACTVVKQPNLAIAKTGPEKAKVGKTATYNIEVTNTGDTPLANVVVVDTAPVATRIVSAQGANLAGNTATWTIASLAPGAKESFQVVLTSNRGGRHCNVAAAQGPYRLTASAEACTLWIGQPAILLELIDTEDALLVGDATTYIVRVTNQGTADDSNVTIIVDFPAGIDPVSASGSTAGTVTGKRVSFAAYPVFKPKEVIEFRIPAKASAEGDNRVKVTLKSDVLTSDLIEDESTTVY